MPAARSHLARMLELVGDSIPALHGSLGGTGEIDHQMAATLHADRARQHGVFVIEYALMASAIPGTSRSQTDRVASGVTSLRESPVPPQVMTMSAPASSQALAMARAICSTSSFTTTCSATVQPAARIRSSRAAPASSRDLSRVSEQVMMANVISIGSSRQQWLHRTPPRRQTPWRGMSDGFDS